MSTTTTTPTATRPPRLSLRPLQDGHGLAVVGHPHTTYKHRQELRANGAQWNRTRRQWEATTPRDCDTLRQWIGRQANATRPDISTHAAPQLAGMFNPYL